MSLRALWVIIYVKLFWNSYFWKFTNFISNSLKKGLFEVLLYTFRSYLSMLCKGHIIDSRWMLLQERLKACEGAFKHWGALALFWHVYYAIFSLRYLLFLFFPFWSKGAFVPQSLEHACWYARVLQLEWKRPSFPEISRAESSPIFTWSVFSLGAPFAGHPSSSAFLGTFSPFFRPRKVLCSVEQRAQCRAWRGAVPGWISPHSFPKSAWKKVSIWS